MKKVILAVFIAAAALSQVQADDSATKGTINFEGKVVAQTCTVKGKNPYEQTVILPTVALNELDLPNTTAGATPFSITLAKCKAGKDVTNVYANFASPLQTNVNSDGRLKNTASSDDAAKNVNIALYQKDENTFINLNNIENSKAGAVALPSSDEDEVTLDYVAKYYATGVATIGAVTSSVEFELAYQ